MSVLIWTLFVAFILVLLAIDLGLVKGGKKASTFKGAAIWVGFSMALALSFTVFVYYAYEYKWFGLVSELDGATASQQYVTAWLLEQSLGLDNVFVFAMVFSFFKIPPQFQHRVLFWGVMGALILRGVMIALGAGFLQTFWWAEYMFALMLMYAAFKMAFLDEDSFDPTTNIIYKTARKIYPLSENLDGEKFFTKLPDGRKAMTPLFLVLLVVESSDVLFAFDSIPAVFGVTSEPFLVFTSNIFAILNLRSLYFILSSIMDKFRYLKTALIVVLMFIAVKMLLHNWFHISTFFSMMFVAGSIITGILASVVKARFEKN